jgi:hypothetical protein
MKAAVGLKPPEEAYFTRLDGLYFTNFKVYG